MFYLFLPFVNRYFFIQHSFPTNFAQKKDMSSWKRLKLSNQALSETMENWIPEVVSKLVSRPFLKRHVEHLELKNCSWTKTIVFIAVLGEKTSLKWSVSSLFLFVRIVNSCFITYMERFFSFMWKNALIKMPRMRMLANYADPHRCVLSRCPVVANSVVTISLNK